MPHPSLPIALWHAICLPETVYFLTRWMGSGSWGGAPPLFSAPYPYACQSRSQPTTADR